MVVEIGDYLLLFIFIERRIKVDWKEVTYDEIYDLYITQQLSQRDIAKQLNIGQTSVRRILKKYNIQSRTYAEYKDTDSYKEKRKELAEKYSKEYTIERYNTCQFCGAEFKVNNRTKNNQYCSKECRTNAIHNKRKKQYCKNCGKEITGYTYKRIYCDECIANYGHLWIQEDKIKTECAYCHKEIFVIPSVYYKNQHCYCSIECMGKHFSKIYQGENSHSWKGGKPRHYTGGFWSRRKEIRERDNYSCQLCGITEEEFGQEMSVHHIKKYRDFDDKKEANDPSNLVCLCEKCHRFVHSNANIDKIFIK